MNNYVDDPDNPDQSEGGGGTNKPVEEKTYEQTEATEKLVKNKIKKIKSDKEFHKKAFEKMRMSMRVAMRGHDTDWSELNYKANIAGRHVKQKTAALYAKNPRAIARRAPRLDFVVWDEDPQSLALAMQTLQTAVSMMQAHQAMAAMPPEPAMATGPAMTDPAAMGGPSPMAAADPAAATGDPTMAGGPAMPGDPAAAGVGADPMMEQGPPEFEPPPGFEQAQAVLADFQQGMERRKMIDKVGKTLEILFAKSLTEQMPVDFKTAAKQLVRRTCTTGVGYIEINFQREYGPRPGISEQLADAKARLDHLARLAEDIESGDLQEDDPEIAELEASVTSLQSEPEIIIREGLVYDFPRSTKVIPDKMTKTLVGFLGARHLTIEYEYTTKEIQEIFGVDLKKYKGYNAKGEEETGTSDENKVSYADDEQSTETSNDNRSQGMVRVWKHYDKPSGLVYFMADGCDHWLRDPAAPDVFVEDFWPMRALTFNEVESEVELFPPSDVELLYDQQKEINRSRQGKREHREAARPRWAYAKSALDEKDADKIEQVKPFQSLGLNIDPQTELAKVLQSFPVPGVDPNLYDTNEVFTDLQLTVGSDEAQFGGTSKATATESAIAEGSTRSANGSSIDDLDGWLTWIARTASVIMLREYSEEQVKILAGPGAVWPHLSLEEIAGELYLEIEAGSSGRPNQAIDMHNWERMLPFLVQMPTISPQWLAKETLKRLDDKMDLTDALVSGLPSIVAQNQMQQPSPTDPGADPNAQGPQGSDKTQKPQAPSGGSKPPFESNQV